METPAQTASSRETDETTFDICVYGGSPAALTAALQARQSGWSVVLVVPEQHLGGMLVEGLGSQDIDNNGTRNRLAIGGLAEEFYQRVGACYDQGFTAKFECSVAEKVIRTWLEERDIKPHYSSRIVESFDAVKKSGSRIEQIQTEDGRWFRAEVFIDATIEGDLMKWAGVSYTTGREGNTCYGETLNGIRATSYRQFAVDVDPYLRPGNPTSGLIPTIQNEPKGKAGEGDHRIMGFCFRQCLTQEKANQIPFAKPDSYDPRQYEIYRRYLAAGGRLFTPQARLPNGKTDLGSWHDLSGNLYGFNHDWPDGTYRARQKIYEYHRAFIEGLYWFLCHDEAVPASLRSEWSKWGLAADEFTDNQGWPRSLYIRSGRRLVSDYVLTEAHTRGERSTEDSIAVAWWPPDAHHCRRLVEDGLIRNEGFFFERDYMPFPISYRALVPRQQECTNLLVPAAPSSSYVAYGSVRLEWTQMVCGQSAALAASEALKRKCAVQDIDYRFLRRGLQEAGQVIQISEEMREAMPGVAQ